MKTWQLIIFFLLASLHSFSQDGVKPPIKFISRFQIFIGPSILYPSQHYTSSYQQKGQRLGYTFGAAAVHSVGRFEVEGRISFEQKRHYNKLYIPGDTSAVATGDLKNNYLSFSLLSKYILDKKGRLKVGLGAYVSLLQKSETTYTINVPPVQAYETGDTSWLYKDSDFGVVTSLSYDVFRFEKYTFGLELLNANGLVNINKTTIPSVISISRNNNLTLSLYINLKQ